MSLPISSAYTIASPLSCRTSTTAILQNPRAILYAQEDALKKELMAQLKAERVPFEERIRLLDEVSYPRAESEFIYETFRYFAEKHPWVREELIRPKAIARELYQSFAGFDDYVRRYRLARSEGVLLRYLGDVYRTLVQNVPSFARTPEVYEILAFLRMTLEAVDSSLFEEWERLLDPGTAETRDPTQAAALRFDLAQHEKARGARIRAELHRLVKLLSERRWREASEGLREGPVASAGELERALGPFFAEYDSLLFDHRARLAEHTQVRGHGPRRWLATQVLLDPEDQNAWCIEAEVDLSDDPNPAGPLLRVLRIGT